MEERWESEFISPGAELLRQKDPGFKISIVKRIKEIREGIKSLKKE